MIISNYTKVKITIDDHEQKVLDDAITLLRDIWKSAPEDSSLEAKLYSVYTGLNSLCEEAELNCENNLYWEEETITEE